MAVAYDVLIEVVDELADKSLLLIEGKDQIAAVAGEAEQIFFRIDENGLVILQGFAQVMPSSTSRLTSVIWAGSEMSNMDSFRPV